MSARRPWRERSGGRPLLQAQIAAEREPGWRWRIVLACMLLNLTTREQVDAAWPRPLELAGTPEVAAAAGPGLEAALRPLGLWRRRASLVRRAAAAYLERGGEGCWDEPELPGCGAYARDAWAVFVLGLGRPLVDPADRELAAHLDRAGTKRSADCLTRCTRGGTVLPMSNAPSTKTFSVTVAATVDAQGEATWSSDTQTFAVDGCCTHDEASDHAEAMTGWTCVSVVEVPA